MAIQANFDGDLEPTVLKRGFGMLEAIKSQLHVAAAVFRVNNSVADVRSRPDLFRIFYFYQICRLRHRWGKGDVSLSGLSGFVQPKLCGNFIRLLDGRENLKDCSDAWVFVFIDRFVDWSPTQNFRFGNLRNVSRANKSGENFLKGFFIPRGQSLTEDKTDFVDAGMSQRLRRWVSFKWNAAQLKFLRRGFFRRFSWLCWCLFVGHFYYLRESKTSSVHRLFWSCSRFGFHC